jgi:hypothetical protein
VLQGRLCICVETRRLGPEVLEHWLALEDGLLALLSQRHVPTLKAESQLRFQFCFWRSIGQLATQLVRASPAQRTRHGLAQENARMAVAVPIARAAWQSGKVGVTAIEWLLKGRVSNDCDFATAGKLSGKLADVRRQSDQLRKATHRMNCR